METRAGLESEARWSDSTLELMVAENKYVCRFSRGRTLRILSRIGPKSRSSNRSASSITKYFKPRKENPLVFSRWSSNRPGVATTICGFLPNAMAWGTISIPPTITALRTEINDPNASKAFEIWYASSRVGARTRPKKDWGLSINAADHQRSPSPSLYFSVLPCKIGSANAAVFPLPVSANPIKSRP